MLTSILFGDARRPSFLPLSPEVAEAFMLVLDKVIGKPVYSMIWWLMLITSLTNTKSRLYHSRDFPIVRSVVDDG